MIQAASQPGSRGDLPTFWSFPFQTREQLQADLLRYQAKIEDLEKLLVEKGQVSSGLCDSWHFCPLGGVPGPQCRGTLCGLDRVFLTHQRAKH